MTILVGVKCKDGVVIGADSMATSAMGPNPLMQLISNDKIQIIGNTGILAATGSVGLAQRVKINADKMWKEGKFGGSTMACAADFTSRAMKDFMATSVQQSPQYGLGFGCLMAGIMDNDAQLIEFGTKDFQPEIKQGNLFYVSMGSGQLLADPFLAFVNRVLWKNKIPDVKMAKIGVYWVLDHTIKYAAGGVGGDIKLAVLSKSAVGWKSELLSDAQEQHQFIAELEDNIIPKDAIASAVTSKPPALGK